MDRHRISAGILSLSTPGVHLGDVDEARRWAREVNEYAADLVRERPDRFGFFATLTLPDVPGSIEEARYSLDELHADGVVLLANNHGRYLGDVEFAPLLEFLHDRRIVVFMHPGELPAPAVPGIPTFAADFLLDTTRTAISLVLSGAMKKYSGISFILAHAGGFVPFIAYRIMLAMLRDSNRGIQAATLLAPDHLVPSHLAVLKKFYYDVALSSTPAALPSLLEVAAPGHITYGSDYPFAPARAVGLMNHYYEKIPLDPEVRHSIDRGAAGVLFPRLSIAHDSPKGAP